MKTAPSTPHRFPVRVYYEDTDAGGIVYHANYLRFMERARTEMLREAGMSVADWQNEQGLIFVVADLHARYRAPARLDDRLIVETSVIDRGNTSITLRQNVLKQVAPSVGERVALGVAQGVAEGDSLLLEGRVTLVLITLGGKPTRLPQALRDALLAHTVTE